ncbi:MAG: hypothetical protein U9P38_06345, partial [Campylobacterota bacterium]|nr:hypothetical protein [Campylobacterota bacterium]
GLDIKNPYATRKAILVTHLLPIFLDEGKIRTIYNRLIKTKISKSLYENLIWQENAFETEYIQNLFNYKFPSLESIYGETKKSLDDELSLVVRIKGWDYSRDRDTLSINTNIRKILKLCYPIPNDYHLQKVENLEDTKYSYSNEAEIFNFIDEISRMLSNNLVEFGKTGDKPLAKTLTLLKSSTGTNEFYNEKRLDTFAIDMLTRSFAYQYSLDKGFQSSELLSLKKFVEDKFKHKASFFITRVLASHLKRVRYDYSSSELDLFTTAKTIVTNMPTDSWISIENILRFAKYRNLRFDLEKQNRTEFYSFSSEDKIYSCDTEENYNLLMFEPVMKGIFFYLASLGLFELRYDEPVSSSHIVAKGKKYITTWDGLRYIKFTELGKYIFGFTKKYKQKRVVTKKIKSLKFDEYKPIITLDEKDTLSVAKLEPFTEKYDENRYILSYAKIFKDCKNMKLLNLKIDAFYNKIEKNPPQVFKTFFHEIKENSNLLKRDLKQVVIELQDNKKLLTLFMKNKKLKELIIKAEGYRVIVLKENIPKLTKIVKDNGFFIEF